MQYSSLQQKHHTVVDVTGNGSKVQCCKEEYCIGSCNVTSMNQGKLELVKQEMARVNIDILRISELKWTGMGEFNSDDYIYYCGQESLRRNGVALIINKSPNTRPLYLPPEKSICRSRSNSQNWTWNNRLVPSWERSTSRLYIVTLFI